jgi:biotin carboxyl carrier protein
VKLLHKWLSVSRRRKTLKRRPKARATKYRSLARRFLIFAILLSVVLLFTWTYIRSALLGALIGVSTGESGTLEDSVSGDAVFAGGVSLISAPAPGTVKFLVKDRDSVRMGQVIAEVGAPATAEAFDESVAFAKSELDRYETETQQEFAALLSAVQPAYEKAVNLFFEVKDAYAAGEAEDARVGEKSLAEVQSVISGNRTRLLAIESERARLAANLSNILAAQQASKVQVLAPASGTFVADVSSIDSKLTQEALASKDASQLLALSREAREARSTAVKEGQSVSTGDALGRVVSGQGVTFYLPVKTEDRPDVGAGKEVEVVFSPGGGSETAIISGIEDGKPPGYSVIVGQLPMVSLDRMVRSGSINLLIRSRSGIILPKSAIFEKDVKTGVLAVQKTYARFQPVEVLMAKGDKAAVRGISAGDEVVTRAIKFLEGKRVR